MNRITVQSSAFTNGGKIPDRYGFRGPNVSPPLEFRGLPAGTGSVAMIVDDPDAPAGVWVHWVIYNLPSSVTNLPEAVSADAHTYRGALNGVNSWNAYGYGGPCPPSGTHRYFFKVYALDTVLPESSGMTKTKLLEAMAGHILAEGELMGTFSR